MNGITHKQAKCYMLADLDGLLAETQRRDLEAHLRDCEACRVESQSFSTLTPRLQSEFHSRWDANDGPSKNVLKNVQSQTRRIIMSNRINLAFKALGGIAALLVLGFAISAIVSQIQKIPPVSNATKVPAPTAKSEEGLIAFVRMDAGGNREIYAMKADGSELTNLTNNPATDESPAWSPDGTRIAFVSDRDGGRDIYLMDADGGNVRKLTDSSTFNDRFAWSPDGERIAYLSGKGSLFEASQIMVIDADGGNKIALTSAPGKYDILGWSPDGQNIVYKFYNNSDNRELVIVARADGTNIIDGPFFSGDGGRVHYQIHWETSEIFITLSLNRERQAWGMWTLTRFYTVENEANIANDNPVLIASDFPIVAIFERTYVVEDQDALSWIVYSGAPIPLSPWRFSELCKSPTNPLLEETVHTISPDGQHDFVRLQCPEGTTYFFLMNSDGSEIQQLGALVDRPLQVTESAWSPNGQHVIVAIADLNGERLFRFDIDNPSAEPIQLTSDGISNYGAVWQPLPPKVVDVVKPAPELYSFTLTVAEAETLAGFDVLEPAYLPAGYVFEGALYDPHAQKVALKYVSQKGDNGALYIYQERGGEMISDPAISAYVTPVAVGDSEGEFIRGVWEYASPNTTTPTWNPRADSYSLAWQKDGFALYIHFLGGETIPPVSLTELIMIAESLK